MQFASKSSFLRKSSAIALAVAAMTSSAYGADNSLSQMFSVSGFGTLGFSHASNSDVDFVSTAFHPSGAGYSKSWSPNVDSKLGLQLNANFTDKFTGVVQVITQQRYDGTYKPSIEWANLAYKITPDLTVRAGRTVWPLFLRSDIEHVGFANYFVRNSAELAAEMPNTFSDGVDASYRIHMGEATNTVQVLAGKSKVKYPGNGSLDVTNIKGLSNVLEYGATTFHLAYMKMDYLFNFPGASADKVALKMTSAGVTYDPGTWFITGDVLRAPDPYYGLMSAFSVGGGYRIGSWTPYVNYSQFKQVDVGSIGGTPPKDKHSTTSLGLRWDFRKNMDIKLQYDRVKSGDVAHAFPINLTNFQPGFDSHPSTNVISLVTDFVF